MGSTDVRFFPLIHIRRLKPFLSPVTRPSHEVHDQHEDIDFDESLLPEDMWEVERDSEDFEVEAILDDEIYRPERTSRIRRRYLLKWKNYDEPTWEDEANLDCQALLTEYDERMGRERRFAAAQTNLCSDHML